MFGREAVKYFLWPYDEGYSLLYCQGYKYIAAATVENLLTLLIATTVLPKTMFRFPYVSFAVKL